MAGARPHRAEPGAPARPTKGGAVRIRIALTTAIAVITGMTTGILTLNTRGAASAQGPTARSHVARVHLSKSALAGFAIPKTVPVVSTTTTPPPKPTTAATTVAPVVTTPPPPVPPPPVTPPPVTDANSVATADWACIRMHESGDRYNSPAAPSGAYGILISTWRSFGLSGWPYEAPASQQDQVALELYARYGFHPWSSRYACGL
jgi:type IV secretory pathway VirB10-like protein